MDANDAESSTSDSFEESASDGFFHDSIEAGKDNRQFSDDDNNDHETQSKPRSRSDLVLDLRNVPPIGNIVRSDDETSEKLSAVIEQPEEHVTPKTTENEKTGSLDDTAIDKILRERINNLQEVIIDLREEVKLALSLWRKERDEFQLLREKSHTLAVEEATAAARAAAEAYAAESPLSNELGTVVDLNPVQSLSELTILEYEKKLAKYQDALALAQAEKRYNMRRKMIANTYRQRLIEVERMCNEELEKIRESATILQPLRQMASQWSVQNKNGIQSDSIPEWNPTSCKSEKQSTEVTDRYDRDTRKTGIVDAEVNMIPELVAARFSYTESSKYDRQGAVRSAKASQSHALIESNSLPSTWYASPSAIVKQQSDRKIM